MNVNISKLIYLSVYLKATPFISWHERDLVMVLPKKESAAPILGFWQQPHPAQYRPYHCECAGKSTFQLFQRLQ